VIHLVSYDLVGSYRPVEDYQRLEAAIRAVSGSWCHLQKNEWLVETGATATAVCQYLAPCTVEGDRLAVTRIYCDWCAYGLTDEQKTWMLGANYAAPIQTVLGFLSSPPIEALLPKQARPIGMIARAILGHGGI
jgi:hypothetical protein